MAVRLGWWKLVSDRDRPGRVRCLSVVIPGLDPGIPVASGGWGDPRIKSGDDDGADSGGRGWIPERCLLASCRAYGCRSAPAAPFPRVSLRLLRLKTLLVCEPLNALDTNRGSRRLQWP
ncbi:MAG: hypothetical protein QOG73_3569 [Acetobacteraceae bacterium]|jgi:hypothetical protein|nr:hypothetical protein [Acetobacteraceae bacterium]